MPELPEVEVVRRGLHTHILGRTITAVRVHHLRAARRHEAGPADLAAQLLDARITGTGRRGSTCGCCSTTQAIWPAMLKSMAPLMLKARTTHLSCTWV